MTVDREQVRRDAVHIFESGSLVPPLVGPDTPHVENCPGCVIESLLAELEQAERERDEAIARIGALILAGRGDDPMPSSLRAGLRVAENEWFNQPTQQGRERRSMLARLAAVPALVEAEREVALLAVEIARWARVAESNGNLHARLASALALRDEALAAYEQAQEQRP